MAVPIANTHLMMMNLALKRNISLESIFYNLKLSLSYQLCLVAKIIHPIQPSWCKTLICIIHCCDTLEGESILMFHWLWGSRILLALWPLTCLYIHISWDYINSKNWQEMLHWSIFHHVKAKYGCFTTLQVINILCEVYSFIAKSLNIKVILC